MIALKETEYTLKITGNLSDIQAKSIVEENDYRQWSIRKNVGFKNVVELAKLLVGEKNFERKNEYLFLRLTH